jgi:hypothetical protein
VLDGNQTPDGAWTVKARYGGDTSHNASEAEQCSTQVNNF